MYIKINYFLYSKVSSWLKLNAQHGGTILNILSSAGTQYSYEDLRNICYGIDGTNPDFCSRFESGSQKEISIKLPRTALKEEICYSIDSCKYMYKIQFFHIYIIYTRN
jgi:hypothetical protein